MKDSLFRIGVFILLLFGIQPLTQITARTEQYVFIYPIESTEFFTNPGIGWQRMEYNTPPLLEETVVYPDRSSISWRVLNPGNGIYDWSELESRMDTATDNGQLFSFRIYTMQGESYGGHKVPQWVLDVDSTIIQNGEPNYSNCMYQHHWSIFVDELIARYDGDPRIAFIDISGYGNFNEWSWTDSQTEWEDDYMNPVTLDGQARQRLADMFIGGSDTSHNCENVNGNTVTIPYSHHGFQETQLVMPYAGIQQSTRYVASRRSDVGIRYDCLGRDATLPKIDDVIDDTWENAPIVFEFCADSTTNTPVINRAETLMNTSHGVIVHENLEDPREESVIEEFMTNVGYRYTVLQAGFNRYADETIDISMRWINVGTSPAYTSMGYDFELVYYFVFNDEVIVEHVSSYNPTDWMPATDLVNDTPPEYLISDTINIPSYLTDGDPILMYYAIVDTITGLPINLAIDAPTRDGAYYLGRIVVERNATAEPTETATNTSVYTSTPTDTESYTATSTQTYTPTTVPDETSTQEPKHTDTPTNTATSTDTPANTQIATSTATSEPTILPTNTSTNTVTPTQTHSPTIAPTAVPTNTLIPTNTVIPPVPNVYLYIYDLGGQSWDNGNDTWTAFVDISVRDSRDRQRSYTVIGTWSTGEQFTCVTHGGWCGVRLTTTSNSIPSVTLTVTDIQHNRIPYNPLENNETSITVSQ